MVDITQPSILGYAITPWFIILCSCIIGTIVFAILVVLGFSKRGSKERELIENAVKNTSNIPVKNIEIPTMDFSIDGQDGTESIVGGKTDKTDPFKTEGFESGTEGLTDGTEGFGIKTEGFDTKTEGLELKTEGLEFKTEGLDLKTEGLDLRTEGFDSKTEGLDMNADSWSKKTEGLEFNSATEAFDTNNTEAFVADKTEGFNGENNGPIKYKSKFCSKCGNKVNGNFCSRCGHQIN